MRIIIFLLSIVALSSCKTHYWADTHVQFQRVADVAPSGDASITTMIAPYKVDLDAQMNGIIAQLDVELTKALPSAKKKGRNGSRSMRMTSHCRRACE